MGMVVGAQTGRCERELAATLRACELAGIGNDLVTQKLWQARPCHEKRQYRTFPVSIHACIRRAFLTHTLEELYAQNTYD